MKKSYRVSLFAAVSAAAIMIPAFASAQETTVKFGGYIKAVSNFTQYSDGEPSNALTRDYYNPNFISTNGNKKYQGFDSNTKQTRLTATITNGAAKGYLEADFQAGTAPGTERVTNAHGVALRRAYIQFGNWTIGQDWSTFQYLGSLPETTDYAGVGDGTVFSRQTQVRYTKALNPNATMMLALENANTYGYNANAQKVSTLNGDGTITTKTADIGASDFNDDRMPDAVARIQFKGAKGELSLAGLVRELRYVNGAVDTTKTAGGVSVGGKMPLNNIGMKSNIGFQATYGDGIGRYMALGASPDAVLNASNKLKTIKTTDAFITSRIGLSEKSRVNLMAGYHVAQLPSSVAVTKSAFTKRINSVAANYFYSPVKNVDLGVEYRYGERKTLDGNTGNINRLEFAAKYAF